MGDSNTTTRTYNPNVRVGNWNEEICLDEDRLKDFLDKQQNGTLLIQRTQKLMHTLLAKTEPQDGDTVVYGGNIVVVNPGREGINSDDKQISNMPRELLNGRKSTESFGLKSSTSTFFCKKKLIPTFLFRYQSTLTNGLSAV